MYGLGFIKSITYGVPTFEPVVGTLPETYSLKEELGVPVDQGDRGICVSVCATEMIKYKYKLLGQGGKYRKRIDFYYNHRSDKSQDGMSPRNAFEIASAYGIISSYSTLKSVIATKVAIAANGPALVALPVYTTNSDFWKKTTKGPIGYHAVTLVGYNDKEGEFYLRNSWGSNWGLGGYTAFPYLEFSSILEAWTIFK